MKRVGYYDKKPVMGGVLCFFLLALSACAVKSPAPSPAPGMEVPLVRYTIQAGAFSTVERAIRLTRALEHQRIAAYYYHDKSGLFKVRFGDFASRKEAVAEAETLVSKGILREYYIVSPEEQPAAKFRSMGRSALGAYLVETAENFTGLPYQWGGTSSNEGFDCSGLVMAVYQLNGFNLPRTAEDQFMSGRPVPKSDLEKGDLVFFSGDRGNKVSHVGVFAGNDTFIHAPGKGKTIRKDLLSDAYFEARFAGARTFLR